VFIVVKPPEGVCGIADPQYLTDIGGDKQRIAVVVTNDANF